MSNTRRLENLTLDNIDELPRPCRHCVFWELGPMAVDRVIAESDAAFEKEAWVSAALLEWGRCGKVCYVHDEPAGFVQYAPASAVPRSTAFPTSPVSADAALLMVARILPEFAGQGLGRYLVQGVAKDLLNSRVHALEAFGDTRWDGPACLLPADFLAAVGFRPVRHHHRFPRFRLDLSTAVSWRADVEAALERLFGVAGEHAVRPI